MCIQIDLPALFFDVHSIEVTYANTHVNTHTHTHTHNHTERLLLTYTASRSPTRQLLTPICRTSPPSTSASNWAQTSDSEATEVKGEPSVWNGAWIRYKSKYSHPMARSDRRHAASTPPSASTDFNTLLVMKRSLRGVDVRASHPWMALPVTCGVGETEAKRGGQKRIEAKRGEERR